MIAIKEINGRRSIVEEPDSIRSKKLKRVYLNVELDADHQVVEMINFLQLVRHSLPSGPQGVEGLKKAALQMLNEAEIVHAERQTPYSEGVLTGVDRIVKLMNRLL